MRNTSASRISRLLALPLAAGLALLASAPQAGASEHAFNPYQLGDNSRGNAQDDRLITRAQAREDLDTLARAVSGGLGGKVGVAPRIFLKKLVADVLDRVDLHPDFDPRQHYALTLSETEMSASERAAASANSVDDIEL